MQLHLEMGNQELQITSELQYESTNFNMNHRIDAFWIFLVSKNHMEQQDQHKRPAFVSVCHSHFPPPQSSQRPILGSKGAATMIETTLDDCLALLS
jgi:hypothetical protein